MIPTEWAVFVTIVVAHALAVASPGPDFAMVVRQSLAFGRSAGLWTAAGIGTGILFHVGYGLFGLAWLTERYPQVLAVLGAAGAAFLLWMGVQALRSRPRSAQPESPDAARRGNALRCFGIGLLTNVLNPKAVLFFVALFTAVVTAPPSLPMQLALGAWLPLATFGWFAGVATVLGNPGTRRSLSGVAHWIDRAMGVVLIALGAVTLRSLFAA